jgi:hypothetical protein
MTDKHLTQLRAFRSKLEAWARAELERQNPRYVELFSQRLDETGDLDGAIKETAHLLGAQPHWYKLLTALADTELALDRVRRAIWFLDMTPPPGMGEASNAGAWAVYHLDQWTFSTYALLERLKKLIKLTVRKLIQKKNPQWLDVQAALLDRVEKLSIEVGKVRHPLTHGGGVVEQLETDRFWEPYLVRGSGLDIDTVESAYEAVQERGSQKMWHDGAEHSTVLLVALMESILDRLSGEAFGDA